MQQASGNTLIAYFLALILKQVGITDPTAQNGINGGLQVLNYATALSAALLVDKFGRRILFLGGFAGMFFSYLICKYYSLPCSSRRHFGCFLPPHILTYLPHPGTVISAINEQQNYTNPSLGSGVVVMIFSFNFFYAGSLTPVPFLYLSEVLPFSLRAKGMMISSFCGIAIGLLLGLVNPIAIEDIGWKYYIVSVVCLVVWIIICWFFFPETKGRSLEKIAEIFDGEDALVGDTDKAAVMVHREVVAAKEVS
jgi:MFS family permease